MLLHYAGWTPDRWVNPDHWINGLEYAGYQLWPEARTLLANIGGVVINTRAFHEQPFMLEGAYPVIFEYWDSEIQINFNPDQSSAILDAGLWDSIASLCTTGRHLIPLGTLTEPWRNPQPLFLVSDGSIMQGFNVTQVALRPLGLTFMHALNTLFHHYLLYRGS